MGLSGNGREMFGNGCNPHRRSRRRAPHCRAGNYPVTAAACGATKHNNEISRSEYRIRMKTGAVLFTVAAANKNAFTAVAFCLPSMGVL